MVTEVYARATFAGRAGEVFRLRTPATTLEAVLDSTLAPDDPGGRPFSLVFRATAGPPLPQQTFTVEHEEIGTFDLFLVPIAADQKGTLYEAVIA